MPVKLAILFLALSTTLHAGYVGLALTDVQGGASVGQVAPGGPAEQAGIRPGDITIAINGTPIDRASTLMEEIINGTSNYHDAKTGRDYNLNNLAPFKWIDDTTGRIVGTESNNKPPFAYSYRALPGVP